jgi:hypothetical protein
MSAPGIEQVRRFVGLIVGGSFSSCPHEYLSLGQALNVSRRINRALSESPEFARLLDMAAEEIAKELPVPAVSDVPGSVVQFAQGRAR